ncbi:MAG: glycosyltransferase family 2 protein [Proteobacteria bacterium]|nr:glycosyltransferase family 2 protein [Desulfobulbaceae bacterium]MBU4154042.1 glycosyltransferase family 2 protein [Pseudomonadota bacterium]
MTKTQGKVSVVAPMFNEGQVLALFAEKVHEALLSVSVDYELIFVDDGSRDDTSERIRELAAVDPRIVGICFSRNFGKEAAIVAGLRHATGSAVVVMDGDGQHPPAILPEMIALWRQGGVEVVAAIKQGRVSDPWHVRLRASLFNRMMLAATGLDLEGGSDFQLLDRTAVDAVLALGERGRFFRGMAQWVGFKRQTIHFNVAERLAGTGRWSIRQLVRLALTAIISFTARPLTWIMGIGALGVAIALLLGGQALFSWFTGKAVSGWTSLTILILFFGSANLFAVGVVGEYLGQVYQEVKQRPLYLVREVIMGGKR